MLRPYLAPIVRYSSPIDAGVKRRSWSRLYFFDPLVERADLGHDGINNLL
jgi:hypothetical protein